ncbi:MAG: hypothetical protein IJJ42_13120 [Clostridia bacterium]|nr:hypothetical protein [Clostridia bacterium]
MGNKLTKDEKKNVLGLVVSMMKHNILTTEDADELINLMYRAAMREQKRIMTEPSEAEKVQQAG